MPFKKSLDKKLTDGVAIFYKNKNLNIVSSETINYSELVQNYNKKAQQRFAGLCIELEDINSKKKFRIITVHLINKYQLEDIKNLQMYVLKKYIDKITNLKQPYILCGDFNSRPTSAGYHGITTGKTIKQFDFEDAEPIKPIIFTPKIFTKTKLVSSYKKVLKNELKNSNYAPNFKDTLDYIFVNDLINIH